MITADQIVAHLVGDYILQSDWMAQEKTKRTVAAAAHACSYTLAFLPLLWSHGTFWLPLLIILLSHFVIDRWRLARYVVWAKNWIGPGNRPWSECSTTGYPAERPIWLTVWLLIIADNTLHLLCNGLALSYL